MRSNHGVGSLGVIDSYSVSSAVVYSFIPCSIYTSWASGTDSDQPSRSTNGLQTDFSKQKKVEDYKSHHFLSLSLSLQDK